MVKLNAGSFLKAKDIREGDLVKILSEGGWQESTKFKNPDGTPQGQFVVTVKFKDEDKSLKLNKMSRTNLIKAWGEETKEWVGKEVKLTLVKVMSGGEMKDSIITVPFLVSGPQTVQGTTPPWDE